MVSEISHNSPLEYISLGVAVTRLLVQSDPALTSTAFGVGEPLKGHKSVACLAGGRLMAT